MLRCKDHTTHSVIHCVAPNLCGPSSDEIFYILGNTGSQKHTLKRGTEMSLVISSKRSNSNPILSNYADSWLENSSYCSCSTICIYIGSLSIHICHRPWYNWASEITSSLFYKFITVSLFSCLICSNQGVYMDICSSRVWTCSAHRTPFLFYSEWFSPNKDYKSIPSLGNNV